VVRNYALHTSDQALLRDYIVQALEEDPYLEKRKEVAQEWLLCGMDKRAKSRSSHSQCTERPA